MAWNEKSSPHIASEAARMLADDSLPPMMRAVAASVLTQSPDHHAPTLEQITDELLAIAESPTPRGQPNALLLNAALRAWRPQARRSGLLDLVRGANYSRTN